jgi:hypothetical protein
MKGVSNYRLRATVMASYITQNFKNFENICLFFLRGECRRYTSKSLALSLSTTLSLSLSLSLSHSENPIISLRSIFILASSLLLAVPINIYPSVPPITIFAFVFTFPNRAHLIFLHFITPIIFGKKYVLWKFSFYSFSIMLLLPSYVLTFSSTVLSGISTVYFFAWRRETNFHAYATNSSPVTTIILHTSNFTLLAKKQIKWQQVFYESSML